MINGHAMTKSKKKKHQMSCKLLSNFTVSCHNHTTCDKSVATTWSLVVTEKYHHSPINHNGTVTSFALMSSNGSISKFRAFLPISIKISSC